MTREKWCRAGPGHLQHRTQEAGHELQVGGGRTAAQAADHLLNTEHISGAMRAGRQAGRGQAVGCAAPLTGQLSQAGGPRREAGPAHAAVLAVCHAGVAGLRHVLRIGRAAHAAPPPGPGRGAQQPAHDGRAALELGGPSRRAVAWRRRRAPVAGASLVSAVIQQQLRGSCRGGRGEGLQVLATAHGCRHIAGMLGMLLQLQRRARGHRR